MRVPDIYELYKSANNDLIEKEKLIQELKKDPLNSYIIHSLEIEIFDLKVLLSRHKSAIREEKLNQLGL